MAKRHLVVEEEKPKLRTAITDEGREQQMIALAMDLVEKRLRNGTASSQETTHFLKLGSTKAKLELEKVRRENQLLVAKTESLQTSKKFEELFEQGMQAYLVYTGHNETNDDEDDNDDPRFY